MWRREARRDLIDFEDERGPGAGTIFYTTLGSDYIALRRREQFAENGVPSLPQTSTVRGASVVYCSSHMRVTVSRHTIR